MHAVHPGSAIAATVAAGDAIVALQMPGGARAACAGMTDTDLTKLLVRHRDSPERVLWVASPPPAAPRARAGRDARA